MSLGMYLYKRKIKKILEKCNLKEEELGAKNCVNCKHYIIGVTYEVYTYCNISSMHKPSSDKICDRFQFHNLYLKAILEEKKNKYNFRDVKNE